MLKRFIALAIISTALALSVAVYVRVAAVQTGGEVDGSLFTISGRAAQASAQGEFIINSVEGGEFDHVDTLDDALSRYTVVVAEPILSRSYVVDDIGVRTWYKMRVDETLSQRPVFQCTGCDPTFMPDPPADMLPLNAGEILIYRGGGNVVVGNVTVDYEVEQFPAFNISQKYLLFLNYDASRSVASVDLGPVGAFVVTSPDLLTTFFTDADGLVVSSGVSDDMSARFNNSLSQFRNFLNPPPPPPACDPDGSLQGACLDDGGSWNPTTCHCTPAFDPCTRKPWLCE